MKYIILTLTFAFVNSLIENEWVEFKKKYNKSYPNEQEELRYNKAFLDNLIDINRHNKLYDEGKMTYKKGITKFADLTDEEFVTKYRFDKRPSKIYLDEPGYEPSIKNISDSFDWRQTGAVSKVKNQGMCGSCWIFAAVGALEGLYFKRYNKSIILSEQNLIDCMPKKACQGGWPGYVFQYINNGNGINTAEVYPSKPAPGECNYQPLKNVEMGPIVEVDVDYTEDALKEALIKHGPLIVCIYAGEKWKLYKSGVWYEKECSDLPNHAVLLVGFGSENGHDYWLIKNSHSTEWGEDGYIKLARNKHRHYCGITFFASYLI